MRCKHGGVGLPYCSNCTYDFDVIKRQCAKIFEQQQANARPQAMAPEAGRQKRSHLTLIRGGLDANGDQQ